MCCIRPLWNKSALHEKLTSRLQRLHELYDVARCEAAQAIWENLPLPSQTCTPSRSSRQLEPDRAGGVKGSSPTPSLGRLSSGQVSTMIDHGVMANVLTDRWYRDRKRLHTKLLPQLNDSNAGLPGTLMRHVYRHRHRQCKFLPLGPVWPHRFLSEVRGSNRCPLPDRASSRLPLRTWQ